MYKLQLFTGVFESQNPVLGEHETLEAAKAVAQDHVRTHFMPVTLGWEDDSYLSVAKAPSGDGVFQVIYEITPISSSQAA